MEKQLSFKLENCSPGKAKNQQEVSKKKRPEDFIKRLKPFDKEKKIQQENQPDKTIKTSEKNPLEQLIFELLPSLKKEHKLESLSLESKPGEKKISEIIPLKENTPAVQSPEKELLFDNLITVKTVAEMLGVAPKTVHNWVSLRKVPFVKCGQKVMFRPKSLKAWLDRKEVKSWL